LGGLVQRTLVQVDLQWLVECTKASYNLFRAAVKLTLLPLQISRHALNSVFAILEIVLPATNPPPWLHVVFLLIVLALYLALAYITHATQGFYVYSFLDPEDGSGKLAGYILGIAAAAIVVFSIVWGVVFLRRKLTRGGKRSKHDIDRASYGDMEMNTSAMK